MNFFGHAVVAGWRSPSPSHALGAMLPDFASMCRGRLGRVGDDDLAAGVSLHHATDKVFHELPEFRELTRATDLRLRARGVARGGARGSAHVAIELLLDGVLIDRGHAHELYLAALDRAPALAAAIEWRDDDRDTTWRALIDRLAAHGVPHGYADVSTVADRLVAVLAPRPLLALDASDEAVVRAELVVLQREIAGRADAIMGSLRAGLE